MSTIRTTQPIHVYMKICINLFKLIIACLGKFFLAFKIHIQRHVNNKNNTAYSCNTAYENSYETFQTHHSVFSNSITHTLWICQLNN
jgi:NADH:ubiquinone oxidoreductase subunit 3 (subunit A)